MAKQQKSSNDFVDGISKIAVGLFNFLVITIMIKMILLPLLKLVARIIWFFITLPANLVLKLAGFNPKTTKALKLRLGCIFVVCGVVWCPLTMVYSLNDPVRAHYLLSKMGFGAFMLYKDVKTTTNKVYSRTVPKMIRDKADRYNVDAFANMPLEVAGYKKPPLYYRMWKATTGAVTGALQKVATLGI